jgi:hypothetical protein
MLGCILEIYSTPSLFVKGDVMSLLHRVVLPALAVVGLGFLIACGSSSKNSVPPPSGGFSNSNFNGTYTFSSTGMDSSGNVLEIAGTITACGCSAGTISAGTVDVIPDAAAGIAVNSSASHYTVNTNGTGTMTLNLGSSYPPYQFAFALTDAAHGLISEYDQNGTGSGTIDLQPGAVTLGTSYAFSLSGTDTSGNSVAAAGALTLNSSGAITTGLVDYNYLNYNQLSGYGGPWSLTGSVSTGTGTSPGAATLNSTFGGFSFDVYAIDATHLKLVENDGHAFLAGDLFSQPSTTIPAAGLTFAMSGATNLGSTTTSPTPFAVAGTVTSDGTATLSSGSEDVNNAGTVDNNSNPATPTSFTGAFVLDPGGNTNGRFQISMSGFFGGTNLAAYPSSGGVLMVEIDTGLGAGITAGSAMTQNSPAGLVTSQGYAMNLSGPSTTGELDQIAQFNTTSSSTSGQLYQNNFASGETSSATSTNSFTGTVTAGSNGGGEFIFNNKTEGAFYYGVDGATSLALGIDGADVSLGVFEQQGSPTSTTDVGARHLAAIKAAIRARAKRKKQQ